MVTKVWKIASHPTNKSEKWLLDVLAKNRGLTTPKKLEDFLNPKLEQILQIPLPNIEKAIKRIEKAIKNKEKIVVYSDYDADGICAAAIIWETLHDLGAQILPYVPHREKEGYGLSIKAIKEMAKENVKLIITVDHGVSAQKEIETANRLGIDVIVTDHHLLPEKLPEAYALIYNLDLAGAGVAWLFCFSLVEKVKPVYKQELLKKLELAALATVADLVPLLGASRAIVKIGLEYLSQSERLGIKSLIDSSGIKRTIGTYEISHILAPRINAMGRIGHALDSLRLICVKDQNQAQRLAQLISKTNVKRQDLTTKAVSSAIEMIDETKIIPVLSHDSWHQGVIGLVATRLVETYHKPMVIISKGKVYSKGSARSIPGFNIFEAIRASDQFLVNVGGHPMAAGFTIETKNIESFATNLNSYAEGFLTEDYSTSIINVECELDQKDISMETLKVIEAFEPFGTGNPQPVFVTKHMVVQDIRNVGAENKHLKIQVNGISAIGFNMGERLAQLRPGYLVDIVYTLCEDHFGRSSQIQLKIKDLSVNNP